MVLRALPQYENNVLALTAVGVGVLAGLGAIVLELSLRFASELFLGGEGVGGGSLLRVVAAPAIGGLVVGPLIARVKEAKGHGVPEVMEAVSLRGGRIRGRVAAVKTLASAITIGSGGSAGREGPIVQVGATLGSVVAQRFGMTEQRARVLVACGVAGGIAAAFNAPLAGVFFALEVVLQRFTARGFATVVLSAVTSSVMWRAAFGNHPVLDVPRFGLVSAAELLVYVLLGLAAAALGVLFVKTLYWAEDRFDSIPIPQELKPALGGLLLGLVGIVMVIAVGGPLVYGSGLPGMDLALGNRLVWWAMLVLLFGKLVATSLTLGSGGSGGVFAPALFMGAMLGGLVGQGVDALFPGATAPPGAYVMVGMAAVFAAAAQAPISAILILFEMTNDYLIIVPLMLACIVATVGYSLVQRHSIYTLKLSRRGIELVEGRERHLIERIAVREAKVDDFLVSRLPTTLAEAKDLMQEAAKDRMVVLDENGRLVGTVSMEGVIGAMEEKGGDLERLAMGQPAWVAADDPLEVALTRMAPKGLRILPMVDGPNSLRLMGVVTRDSLLGAYWNAVSDQRPATRIGEDG